MFNIKLANKISKSGLNNFGPNFKCGEEIENPDAYIVRSADLLNTEFEKSVLAIARAGAGVNNIPIGRCSENGIVVFNTPGANANAVKELAICALLISSRKIVDGINWAKSIADKGAEVPTAVEKGKSAFIGPEIFGKSLGLIGLGAIGEPLANSAVGLGMRVYGIDPYMTVDTALRLTSHLRRVHSNDDIFANSDYISLHVPSTPETKGMINAEAIAKMKDGVRIINLSRADLVNAKDMGDALESGKVACYATDFPTAEALSFKNCICIPHLGASTPESEENCAVNAVQELSDYLINGNIKNSVNLPDVELPGDAENRICVIHKNIPNVLSRISTTIAEQGINIDNMINKSKKDYAYTMLNANGTITAAMKEKINNVEGVIRVRII